ncbi:hypothetical protein OCU04_007998 [Sclerotinia nivalis]|uniref:Uncharacterized protein n=1 Tax=Sclerotinia nivalis TaxID=352851 RepID=A0A9X0DH68_9HELO|nr:hypothetical protein OCU04_007998 [Sclerotinia nivalis]
MDFSRNLEIVPSSGLKLYNILFLGTAGSGKASLKNSIGGNEFLWRKIYDPTLDDSFRTIVTVDSEQYIVDIANLDNELCVISREQQIRDADGIILVYSICSPKSFSVLESLWTSVKLVKAQEKKGLYVDIVGTMSDLWEKRSVKTEDGKALAQRLNCGFSECSAKEGENCKVVIEDLVRKIVAGQEQEKILRDARRRKEDDAREEREGKKNGVVKRVLRRFLELMAM